MKFKEVAEMLGIPPAKLEEWTKNYEWLNYGKFGEKQLQIVKRINELEKRGYTLAGIRRRIFEEFGPPVNRSPLLRIRRELVSLLTFLRSDDNIN